MKIHCLEIWGPLACFSRPEMKVERYSYPCITPSAARGVLDAIYVKPRGFRWQVDRIALLHPPSYIALRRNEVKDTVNVRAVDAWIRGKNEPEPLWADGDRASLGTDERGRTQRQTMALRDPKYRLWAHVVPWPGHESRTVAFDAQFERRARAGKCFFQPYLGCREFPAYFELVEEEASGRAALADVEIDLGFMLYDVFNLDRPGNAHDRPAISLFAARVVGGVLEVPPWEDAAVLKLQGGA